MRILPIRPSSTASSSIVALSVSISASTLPLVTWSPSRTSHLASLPSVMVGDSAGIRICVVMCGPLSRVDQNVRPQLGRIGFWALLREFGGGHDDVLDLLVDRLEVVLAPG